jgi:hypothetical protein
MGKPAILLVHGMGKHAAPKDGKPGSFGQEFEATTATLQQFAAHKAKTDKLENYFDIHEFNFDQWFDERRKEMAKNAAEINAKLPAIGAKFGPSIAMDLAKRLNGIEAKFGDDSFFYTHWLDVIFYAMMLGEKIRVDLGVKITELVEKYEGNRVHIVAHSLGTAVVHDTLALLYGTADGQAARLDTNKNKLASIWMFANVSRLVNLVTKRTDPMNSAVRPGPGGCTAVFYNVRHRLDPFTWVAEFQPPDDGSWVTKPVFADSYERIETKLIVEANTHSFPQYLRDPLVAPMLLRHLLELNYLGTAAEETAYAATEEAKGLKALAEKLKPATDRLENQLKNLPSGVPDFDQLVALAKIFGLTKGQG